LKSLDDIDQKILDILAVNPRISALEISKTIGVPYNTTYCRIKKMHEDGKLSPSEYLKEKFGSFVIELFQNAKLQEREVMRLRREIEEMKNLYIGFKNLRAELENLKKRVMNE